MSKTNLVVQLTMEEHAEVNVLAKAKSVPPEVLAKQWVAGAIKLIKATVDTKGGSRSFGCSDSC